MQYIDDDEYYDEDGETRKPAILMGDDDYLIKVCLSSYTVYSFNKHVKLDNENLDYKRDRKDCLQDFWNRKLDSTNQTRAWVK